VSESRPRSSAWTHFHVVAWAIEGAGQGAGSTMTKAGITDRHAIRAVRKNRPDLSTEQRFSLAEIATTNKPDLKPPTPTCEH
jgi:hypothetical protein